MTLNFYGVEEKDTAFQAERAVRRALRTWGGERLMAQMTCEEAREVRRQYLLAFDIYKGNVQYGIEEETAEERQAAVEWYNALRLQFQ